MLTGSSLLYTILVLVLAAGGVHLLLPHRHGETKARTVYIAGGVLASLGLLGFLSLLSVPTVPPDLSGLLAQVFFYSFSATALGTAVMTVTSRNPVYSALWFAGVVLSTSGLFVLAGAQFLAAGTVIVYAGAIIVTFLFVIMLAQMEGRAVYDRAARSPGIATLTCFVLLTALIYCLIDPSLAPLSLAQSTASNAPESILVPGRDLIDAHKIHPMLPLHQALDRSFRPTSSLFDEEGKAKPEVAGLGEALYTDYLIVVELAGSLLFVALIAAIAITNPKRPIRPGDPEPVASNV